VTFTSSGGYASFVGGSSTEQALGVAVDEEGAAYLAGWTWSPTFPEVPGLGIGFQGPNDAFVTKLDFDGGVVYSTVFGGTGCDGARDVDVNHHEAHITGWTSSENFPLRNPVHGYRGSGGAFLLKLTAAGNDIVYSTHLGGGGIGDVGTGVAVDPSGNAYITGRVYNSDFPTTPGAWRRWPGGPQDGFVTKLASDGTLTYSTFLGGTGVSARSIALGGPGHADGLADAFVCGSVRRRSLPVVGTPTSHRGGDEDAFVLRLSEDGAAIHWLTYLGGGFWDEASDIDVDPGDASWVAGTTWSSDFPTTDGTTFDPALSGSTAGFVGFTNHAFVARLGSDGAIFWVTLLQGNDAESGSAVAVSGRGDAQVAGSTLSSDLPVSPDALQSVALFNDGFVASYDAAGTRTYCSYFGGEGEDAIYGIALDSDGSLYLCGLSDSLRRFPVGTPRFSGGYWDAFAARLKRI
jgi:hypothetical protein